MTNEVSAGTTSDGDFSATISSMLQPFTTYYYKALVKKGDNSGYKYGEVRSFTTNATSGSFVNGSLELPGSLGNADKVVTVKRASNQNATNYTFNYSYGRYAALWTAYSLKESDVRIVRSGGSWAYYPTTVIPSNKQVNVKSNSYGTNYGDDTYSRGHQIPDADRYDSNDKDQTYYLTNQTPQIQNGFNSGIWSQLEKAGRGFVVTAGDDYQTNFKQTDILYIVTGPCYQKINGNETVKELTATSSSIEPNKVPVPNYYWKAFLKVRKDASGNILSAKAIGFWFEHKTYSDSYTDHVVSVNDIEDWTGFDLFTNLPDAFEDGTNGAEKNASWTAFRDF